MVVGYRQQATAEKKLMARGTEALQLPLSRKRVVLPEVYDARRCSPHRK